MRYPVLSLYPPWAYWVGWGWKTVETRLHDRFRSLAGQTILLHVAQRWDRGAFEQAEPYLTDDQKREYAASAMVWRRVAAEGHPPGYPLGIRYRARVREVRRVCPEESRLALIDCASTIRVGLFLDAVELIQPIAAKGRQGIWYYDGPVEVL